MARGNTIKALRTTRANLDAQAAANNLIVGELYFITDELRVAVGTAVNAYTKARDDGMFHYGAGANLQSMAGSAVIVKLPTMLRNGVGATYSAATGEWTITKTGWFELEWNLVFTGTAMDPTGSYLSVQVSTPGAPSTFADTYLDLAKQYSTIIQTINGSAHISTGAGAKVRLAATIAGTSVQLGNASWLCAAGLTMVN